MKGRTQAMHRVMNYYRKISIQAKATIWFAMCSIFQKGISFITVPIFTRCLTTEEYGTYSLYLSWLQILTIITSLYLYQGVFNNGMTKYEDDRDRYISSMQGLTVIITVGVYVIYAVTQEFWSKTLGLKPIFITLMFAEMLVTPALSYWSGRQRFEYRYRRLVIITILKSVANPLLGMILVYHANDRAFARVLSVVLVEVSFCCPIMVYQFVKGNSFIDKKYWKYALTLAIPLVPHYLAGMILNQGDRVMIDKMVGKSEVAYYSLAYSIGMLVQIFISSVNSSITPWLYQKLKSRDVSKVKTIINLLLFMVVGLSMVIIMISPELVLIFGSSKYVGAVYVIPPVASSVYFIFLYRLLAIPQFYFEKTRFIAISSIAAATLNIFLNYFFIRLFGYIAAGYTTLACYIIYSLGHYIVSKKVLKENLEGAELYDSSFILLMSALVILIGSIANRLFNYWYIRYTLLFGVAVFVVEKRQVFIEMLKNDK